jgi:hypothetical protein
MECRLDYRMCLCALRALGRGLFYRHDFGGWDRHMAEHIWCGSLCMDVEKWVTKRECSSKTNCMGNRSLAYMVSPWCGGGLNQISRVFKLVFIIYMARFSLRPKPKHILTDEHVQRCSFEYANATMIQPNLVPYFQSKREDSKCVAFPEGKANSKV